MTFTVGDRVRIVRVPNHRWKGARNKVGTVRRIIAGRYAVETDDPFPPHGGSWMQCDEEEIEMAAPHNPTITREDDGR